MRLQVLLSTMHQKDHSIIDRVNIQTDAIIINQADDFKKEIIKKDENEIQFLTFNERGVGLSRNNALMRSTADIVLLADDDVQYVDGYGEKVIAAFKDSPEADMIVFNVLSKNHDRPSYEIKKYGRVRLQNCLRYGTYRMAFRTDKVKQKNIYFSLLFGGGAKYSSGEDSLFIYTVIKSGLKVFKSPEFIGSVEQSESTWFQGYTDKFFQDKGALFRSLSPKLYPLLLLQFIARRRVPLAEDATALHALRQMFIGAKSFGSITKEDV